LRQDWRARRALLCSFFYDLVVGLMITSPRYQKAADLSLVCAPLANTGAMPMPA
jgi:hypothetical protein